MRLAGNIAAIGDQIVKLIAAEAKNQDQKIMLLRYLKEVVFDNKVAAGGTINFGKSQNNEDEKGNVTTERRNELLNFVADELEKKEQEKLRKEGK